MLIQKLNAFNTQRYQARGINNQPQTPSYMSNVRGNAMGDTVSFGLNLEPKIISPELNKLFGRAIEFFDNCENNILHILNKPLEELKDSSGLNIKINSKIYTKKDIEVLERMETLEDGTILSLRRNSAKTPNSDYLTIKTTNGDKGSIITIQDNCVTKIKTLKGKVSENVAFISKDYMPEGPSPLRFGVEKNMISSPGESSKLNEFEAELKGYLEKLLS